MIEVLSDMDGCLSSVLVDDGCEVEEGEKIAEIELMKTFFPVEAPASGVITFKIALGEIVEHGGLIAIIEET